MSNPTITQKSFFHRISIYSSEMFPVLIYLPFVVALYVCMNVATQIISGSEVIFDIYGIVGMISAFFAMLMMRTFDDLKDIDIDEHLFPHRAIPRGDVKKRDVTIISIVSFTTLVMLNLFFAQVTLIPFIIMMVYTVLTFYWFFAEEFHRKNVLFTMFTHQPIPLAINFYLIHTALASGGNYNDFTAQHFALLLIFTLPVTAWESARKIRGEGMETEYETFSMVFGTRRSAFIPLTCLLVSGGLALYIGSLMALGASFFAITVLLIAGAFFAFGRFIMNPTAENNILKNAAMLFSVLLFMNMLVHMLMNYKVINHAF